MVSQLSLSSLPPTFPPLSLCLWHHLHVRNRINLPPSTDTHTCTLCHAPAEECTSHLHPPSFLPPSLLLLSSTLPHLLTSSLKLGPLFSPLFRLPLSLSPPLLMSALPLHQSFPLIFLQCVTVDPKPVWQTFPISCLYLYRSLKATSNKWRCERHCHTRSKCLVVYFIFWSIYEYFVWK